MPDTAVPVAMLSSADVRAEMARLAAERADAERTVTRLAATYNDVLLSDDDAAAEQHEAESAKAKRTIARATLKLEQLEDDLAAAERRELDAMLDEQIAAVAKVREAAIEGLDVYRRAAAEIAVFLEKWRDADRQIQALNTKLTAAGRTDTIRYPETELRSRPEVREPATWRTDTLSGWYIKDEDGRERPFVGVYVTDRKTGELRPQESRAYYNEKAVVIEIPERVIPAVYMTSLHLAVNLPAATFGEKSFWDMDRR